MSADPVAADEFVLRRIHKNMVQAGPPPIVSYLGFRPTPDDTNGLSVYREIHIAALDVAASGRKPGEYYVARLRIADLAALGLSVVVDEQAHGPPGHALIPELSFDACQQNQTHCRQIQIRLAALACSAVVVMPEK